MVAGGVWRKTRDLAMEGGAAGSRLGFPWRFLVWWKVAREDEPVVVARVKTNKVGGGVDGVLTVASRLRHGGKVGWAVAAARVHVASQGFLSPVKLGFLWRRQN
ncbi:hypothetical protein VIGAN_04161900 [Vigna angularis var. angularis]|uniref:Uncharacterized protein n=1 Tax=Vigna angularis var. angularis TaxID=157739 RepID=A0A0S3RUK8_PHAAN|nr:hypothetical protein VIGAN_04161900 [Vigna angularis var. angularis]